MRAIATAPVLGAGRRRSSGRRVIVRAAAGDGYEAYDLSGFVKKHNQWTDFLNAVPTFLTDSIRRNGSV